MLETKEKMKKPIKQASKEEMQRAYETLSEIFQNSIGVLEPGLIKAGHFTYNNIKKNDEGKAISTFSVHNQFDNSDEHCMTFMYVTLNPSAENDIYNHCTHWNDILFFRDRLENKIAPDGKYYHEKTQVLKFNDEEQVARAYNLLRKYLGVHLNKILDNEIITDLAKKGFVDLGENELIAHKTSDKPITDVELSCLDERERAIIEMYYGLGETKKKMLLEEIGDSLGLTRNRVKLIRDKALRKLNKNNPVIDLSRS